MYHIHLCTSHPHLGTHLQLLPKFLDWIYLKKVQDPCFSLVVGTLFVVVFFKTGVAVVALQMHRGMLCEVLRDRTGPYVLSQKYITLILASVLQVCIYCKVLSWLHHDNLQ